MENIKKLKNGKNVVFDQGRFDKWCVYLVEKSRKRKPPEDKEYFSDLQEIAEKYPRNKIYNDFLCIYNKTDKEINDSVIALIDDLTETYDNEDKEKVEELFTIIYATMIAEENKKNTKLGKRIKRLGIYQVLVLNMSPEEAAKFSDGKNWKELDKLMKQYSI